jgi:hypothetical protein
MDSRNWLGPAWGLAILSFGLFTGCGGGGKNGGSESKQPARETAEDESDEEAGEESEPEDPGERATAKPRRKRCDDGTCFECGAGICPAGFYCDQNAEGGAACSWLPECPSKVSCGCIKKTLGSACSCEEKGGGHHVSCQ